MKAGGFVKYTRLEIYKGISNSRIKGIFVFFVIIPVIAVLSGSIITRILIPKEQIVSSNENVDEPSIVVNISKSYSYKFFLLQAGAFMNKSNAEVLKEAIKGDDFTPFIITDNEIYRVIISLSTDKEILIKKKDKLETIGYNCLINEFAFNNVDGTDNIEIEKANNYVKISADIIKLQTEINESFSQKDTSKIENLKKLIINFNNCYTELVEINSIPILKTSKSNFEQFANDFIKDYENGDLSKCQENTGQQVLLLNNYYDELVKKIIK